METHNRLGKPLVRKALLIFSLVFLACLPLSVYAVDPDEAVSLPNLPGALESAFGITDASHLSGGILASLIFLVFFCTPVAFATRASGHATIFLLFVAVGVVGFSLVLGWLPSYFILFEGLLVSSLFAGQIRDWISGKGSTG